MKMYTLEQLKTKYIVVNIPNKEEVENFLKNCIHNNLKIDCCETLETMCKNYKEKLCFSIGPENVTHSHLDRYKGNIYVIITPDQIDWGEDKQAEAGKVGIYLTPSSAKFTPETILSLPAPKQDNTPAVFTKAQKDWNAFKAFVKEIETHGRGLTSSQLKTFMAKTRKDIEDK